MQIKECVPTFVITSLALLLVLCRLGHLHPNSVHTFLTPPFASAIVYQAQVDVVHGAV
jgi:hypothetical protein